jgi:MFS family permease
MKKFWWLAITTTLVVASFSMFGPVLAVLLQQRGYGTAMVGAFAMIPFGCVALLIPLMPRVFARFGIGRAYVVGMVLETLSTLGYVLLDSFGGWCLAAVVGGVGAAALWNATEALLAEHAPPHQRGHVMGLYQTLLGAALAAGPFVPVLLRWQPQTTLMAATLVQLCALVIGLSVRAYQPSSLEPSNVEHPSAERSPTVASRQPGTDLEGAMAAQVLCPVESQIHTTWQALRRVPALALIAFVGGVFEAGLSSVSAANGAELGLALAQAASIAGAIGVGSFAFQYPAGFAADRHSLRSVFGAAGMLLLVASLAFAAAPHLQWLLYVTAVLWGGVGGALYTLSMISVAHQFNASMGAQAVAAGTAAMITGYTLGGAVGPVISGSALQWLGATGLSAWLCLLSVAVLCAAARVKSPPAAHH